MKRLLTILLTLSLLLSLAACGSKKSASGAADPDDSVTSQEPETGGSQPDTTDEQPDGTDEPEETQPAEQEPAEDNQAQPEQEPEKAPEKQPEKQPEKKPVSKPAQKPIQEKPVEKPAEPAAPAQPEQTAPAASGDALSILTAVWNTYNDDEKFPVSEDAPISMDISSIDNISYLLTFPAEDAALIDGAASLTHMMNLNTFTCGAFHLTNKDDVESVAQDLRDAIQTKQWMCGFPDKLVVLTYDQYVVSLYGAEDLVDTFRDKLTAVYGDAAVAYDEAIV